MNQASTLLFDSQTHNIYNSTPMPKKSKAGFFYRLGNKLSSATVSIKKKPIIAYSQINSQLKKRPVTFFVAVLVVLFTLILLSSFLTKPKKSEEITQPIAREVNTFNIGQTPNIKVNAQIQKTGVVQITAQTGGIVTKIHTTEGKNIKRGSTLISLGNNYLGANASSIQKQLAQTQYNFAKDNLTLQQEIISKQRDIANKNDTSQDDLRSITDKSISDTKDLISLNENILSSLDSNIKSLEDTNIGNVNDDMILQTKQLKLQLLSGLNQTKNGLRNSEYSMGADNAPAQISNLSRELVQKQLDLQGKSLNLNLETARLQYKLAQINESIMYPASPFEGIIQRVHVKVGQTVSPGTPLITIASSNISSTATAQVTRNVAQNINKIASSYLEIDGEKIETAPVFISTEATNGQLYSVIFTIPEEYQQKLTDQSFINIEIPIGSENSASIFPFIPLDSVHQTLETAIVFVAINNRAEGKTVRLGEVQGSFVQILEGLDKGDQIILDRSVIAGDTLKIL